VLVVVYAKSLHLYIGKGKIRGLPTEGQQVFNEFSMILISPRTILIKKYSYVETTYMLLLLHLRGYHVLSELPSLGQM
jgi:hypothetical protein